MTGTGSTGARRSGTATRLSTERIRPLTFSAGSLPGWRVAIPGGRPLATPAVVGGRAYVGGGFGSHEFYAFDAASGAPLWALHVSDDGPSAAVVSGGRVVFNTESCTLFVVDADTGEPAWSRWLGDPLMAQPAVHAGVVFMAYPHADRSHRLAAFALGDGAVLWETPLAGDVISAPVVAGDSVYATTFDGCVHRLLRSSGETVWRRDMRATSAPWVHGDEVHVSQRTPGGPSVPLEGFTSLRGTGELLRGMSSSRPARYLDDEMQSHSSYGSSTSTSDAYVGFGSGPPPSSKSWVAAGNVGQRTVRGLWEYQGSRPTVLGDRSYATQGTSVRASETRTGTPCWERELPGDLRTLGGHLGSPPACAGGKVVVGTASGEVIAFAAGSGEVALRVPLGEEVRFQPALVRGRVHVGTTRGGLVAFDTGDPTLDGWTMWGGGPCHNGAEAA